LNHRLAVLAGGCLLFGLANGCFPLAVVEFGGLCVEKPYFKVKWPPQRQKTDGEWITSEDFPMWRVCTLGHSMLPVLHFRPMDASYRRFDLKSAIENKALPICPGQTMVPTVANRWFK
jgi:hypothetical protein